MKILVTGGGFIGHHVVAGLLAGGHEVTVLERSPDLAASRFEGVRCFLGDLRDRNLVTHAVRDHEGVMNLAGILGTAETVDDPFPSLETNVRGALNVLEGCRPSMKCPDGVRGVQISVGNHFMNNTYAITKSAAERFALMYNAEHATKVAVVRALNAYGEGQKARPVRKMMPNFILSALAGEPIQIYGDGEQIMDMIYVKDVARILILALIDNHGQYDAIFEAGTGRRTTVNQIAQLVNDCARNTAGCEHVPMRAGEPEHGVVLGDPATLASLDVSARDFVRLEDGIERTVHWYRTNYDGVVRRAVVGA